MAAVEVGGASPEDYAAVIKANQLARKRALREQSPAELAPQKKRGARKAPPEAEAAPEKPLELKFDPVDLSPMVEGPKWAAQNPEIQSDLAVALTPKLLPPALLQTVEEFVNGILGKFQSHVFARSK